MGDRDDRARVLLEMSLQPGDRLGVEMIGRLVEQQQVGCREQEPAQRHPAALTSRQSGHRVFPRWHAEGVHGDIDLALQVPGARRLDPAFQVGLLRAQSVVVGLGVRPACQHLLIAVEERLDRCHPFHHVSDDVLARVEHRFLRQQADGEPLAKPGLARCGLVLAGHDPQQGGLSGAVGADHPDLGAVIEAECDLAQHVPVGRDMAGGAHHRVDEVGHRRRR